MSSTTTQLRSMHRFTTLNPLTLSQFATRKAANPGLTKSAESSSPTKSAGNPRKALDLSNLKKQLIAFFSDRFCRPQ